MKKAAVLFLLLLASSFTVAQTTHTFTFGPFTAGCAEFQTLDGEPANQGVGYAGEVCFPYGGNPWWGIETPQVWEFPNNGYLLNNTTTPQLSAATFVKQGCDFKTVGCVDYETGTAQFAGYGDGVTVSVTAFFQVNKHIGRYGRVYYTNDPTNGSGTVQ
jgi:hypothetical protein